MIEAEFLEGSHSPSMSTLQIVAAGTNTDKLYESRRHFISIVFPKRVTRLYTYVPYLSAMMPGKILEGTFIAFRMARR